MIKKITVKGLLREGRDLSWNINGLKFLYGQNGIGKTTLLDSIYYALTNENKIFHSQSDTSQTIIRTIPYEELNIDFDNNESIKLHGDLDKTSIMDKFKKVFSIIGNNENQNFSLFKNQVKSFEEKIQKYIHSNPDIKSEDYNESLVSAIIYNNKQNHEKGFINNNNLFYNLNSLYSSIINEENEEARKSIIENYEVIYLTIERMAPEIVKTYLNNEIFKKHFKYKLTSTIQEIVKDFENELNKFTNQINSISNETLKDALLYENTSHTNEENVSVSLNEDRENLFNVLCDFLNIERNKVQTKDVKNSRNITQKAIKLVNQIDVKIKNNIDNMTFFIEDINDFLKTNNKKVEWSNKSMIPAIKDKNNPNHTILSYPYSSGEKQIITILFNINFFKKNKLLILADEIEISLAPDWQEMLYEKIKLKNNVELIGVTHSPFVVNRDDINERLGAFENELT